MPRTILRRSRAAGISLLPLVKCPDFMWRYMFKHHAGRISLRREDPGKSATCIMLFFALVLVYVLDGNDGYLLPCSG